MKEKKIKTGALLIWGPRKSLISQEHERERLKKARKREREIPSIGKNGSR
jgi:hypothetical protein